MSEFRDLIFHVQEHRFTLPQIKSCLNELGLKFCGFEVQDIDSRFREFHGEASDICDLVLWHEFEESHPDTFKGMYQFWFGPFRWVCASGSVEDLAKTDAIACEVLKDLKKEAPEEIQQQMVEAKKNERTNALKEVKRLCKEFGFTAGS